MINKTISKSLTHNEISSNLRLLALTVKDIMELFTEQEIMTVLQNCGLNKSDFVKFTLERYSEQLVGYLGEHLRLIIDCVNSREILFVKCVPRYDEYKAEYLRQTTFFVKEFALLSSLFNQFSQCEGTRKWRPELYYIKENAFVFEDVTLIGYTMPDCHKVFTYEETIAVVEAIARLHAQTFIFEGTKSKTLKKPYSVWDDFSDYLFEPKGGQPWRDTGRNAVIDLLKTNSVYKDRANFNALVDKVIPSLFERATHAMKPSMKHRNAVVHRDVWANNVFFKKLANGNLHALIVDYQTAIYAPPLLDVSAFIFFNTDKIFRKEQTDKVLNAYYECLSDTLKDEGLNVSEYLDKENLLVAYEESLIFGITQAALIVPIANLPLDMVEELRNGGEKNCEFDSISRTNYFRAAIMKDKTYEKRILELFDDIVERFILPLLKD